MAEKWQKSGMKKNLLGENIEDRQTENDLSRKV